jgi:hypothetical protein
MIDSAKAIGCDRKRFARFGGAGRPGEQSWLHAANTE